MKLHITLPLVFVGLAASASRGAVVTFHFDTLVTGDLPVGTDIATLTITDLAPGSVLFNLSHNATSASGQFLGELWFNVSPYVEMTQLDRMPSNKFGGFYQGLNTEQNAGLQFDGRQSFVTSNSGGGANRLKPGQSASFTLHGAGLDALDFVSTAVPQGNQRDDVLAMIHVQGIPGADSGKLAAVVPEPATLGAISLGLLGLAARRRKA